MKPADRPALTGALLATLGFLASVAPFATDMYLASFTDITSDLGASPASVQLTLTAFLIGLGAGQLLFGPLSDRWGRRPVLLTAQSVFVLSSVAMTFSPTIEVLVALRLVQGATGASGVVLAMAIAVDLSIGATAVRAISLISTVSGLAPLIAPPIGGLIATWWGWRGVLAVLAAISIVMFALAWLMVPESLPRDARHGGGIATTISHFGELLRDAGFVAYALAFGLGFATMMAYISASPFVGQTVLGMSPVVYSLGFALGATALVAANLTNSRIAPRVGPARMLLIGVGVLVVASAAMLVLDVTGFLSPVTFIACAFGICGGTGFVLANASALAMARAKSTARGAASAIINASRFLLGGIVSPVVGLWGEDTALPMAITMLVAAVAASVFALVANRARPRV